MRIEVKLLHIGPGDLWPNDALARFAGAEVRLDGDTVGTIVRAWQVNDWIKADVDLPERRSYAFDDPWAPDPYS